MDWEGEGVGEKAGRRVVVVLVEGWFDMVGGKSRDLRRGFLRVGLCWSVGSDHAGRGGAAD